MSKERRKGTNFESAVVGYLSRHLDERIERRAMAGINDKGDVSGVTTSDGRSVVVECKAHKRFELSRWVDEARTEAANARAAVGVVVAKRPGAGEARMGDQYVVMGLSEFVELLRGAR